MVVLVGVERRLSLDSRPDEALELFSSAFCLDDEQQRPLVAECSDRLRVCPTVSLCVVWRLSATH